MTGQIVTRSHTSFWRIVRLLSIVAMIAMVLGANLQCRKAHSSAGSKTAMQECAQLGWE